MGNQKKEILNYYDQLAPEYDKDRFGNSYGHYLDHQERTVLQEWLENAETKRTLDLGCGTGRLLDFAQHGVDFSQNMLSIAQQKYPQHQLTQSDITALPFSDGQFTSVFSFHVLMHLEPETIQKTLQEVYRILEKDGVFICDFPNIKRRKAINYKKAGWHGNTALDLVELQRLAGDQWHIRKSTGFLLFPIHRFPTWSRPFFRYWDSLLSKTFLKHFASYYCVCLVKGGRESLF